MATKEKTKYIEAVGRRKRAIARVRLAEAGKHSYSINDKAIAEYFPTEELQNIVTEPLRTVEAPSKYAITILVRGGGIHSQAEAARLGIARSLIIIDEKLKKPLKDQGMTTRDGREKERRKFGLKKARKSPQWSKR